MSTIVIVLLEVVTLVVTAVGLIACHRELSAIRRCLAALDEGQGRRLAMVVVSLQGLRGPLDALRAGVDGLSSERRDTVEQRSPPPPTAPGASPTSAPQAPPTSAAGPARTSTGTLMSMPAQAAPSSGSAPKVVFRAVCRLCEGSGIVRVRSGALNDCGGCAGSGYIEPLDEHTAAQASAGERRAQLPG